ncbi:heparinase II/III family protein [Nonomuraea sp. NPDC050663]|uniref:heparinase II/III domain-containing protein n=1 Tax=Nonomuraea sp. NPDC050663 TaxID=3364370 RepID=UPI0037879D66
MRRRLLLVLVLVAGLVSLAEPGGPSLAASKGRPICDRAQFAVSDALKEPVSFHGLPAVRLGPDVDWRMDPHRNRSWMLSLHALRWMGRLVVEYEKTGDDAYLERAEEITRDWVRDNPRSGLGVSEWAWAEHAVALRAPTLVCLSAYVRSDWLSASLVEHAGVLADPGLYRAGHNHGLDQDIALLGLGCRLEVGQWRDLALSRMTSSARQAVDDQGVLREQAPRYGVYVHQRLGVAFEAMRECGLRPPPELAARRTALEAYVGHATQPDGRLVAIGDGPADLRPRGFPRPQERIRVFAGGYVFGRSSWHPSATFYSIRFGPGRQLHGHEDHMGVTFQIGGRDQLVEAGFHSYERTAYQAWTVGPTAHNVPVVEGARFRPGTATRLVSSSIGRTRQVYELTDDAYGVSRTRKVMVEGEVMSVLDEVPAGSRVRSLWHLAPGSSVRVRMFEMPGCRPLEPEARTEEISVGYLRKASSTTLVSPAARAVLTVVAPARFRVTCPARW